MWGPTLLIPGLRRPVPVADLSEDESDDSRPLACPGGPVLRDERHISNENDVPVLQEVMERIPTMISS
jgi:hypothetical protein